MRNSSESLDYSSVVARLVLDWCSIGGPVPLVLRAEQNGFLVRALDFDTVGFNARVVFEGLRARRITCIWWITRL